MQSDQTSQDPERLAVELSISSANAVALISESLIILSQKRRTLEEKVIFGYFHRLCVALAGLIGLLHGRLAEPESLSPVSVDILHRLKPVTENIAACVQDLLKALKYDFNYVEQYFEHDYCDRLLTGSDLLAALEKLREELETEASSKPPGG
jgi:hypothetical protein